MRVEIHLLPERRGFPFTCRRPAITDSCVHVHVLE